MEEKLNNAWSDFSSVMAERGARLSVALMFHRSAEKVRTIIIQLLLVIVLSFRSVVRNLKSLGRLPVYALTGPNHTNETLFHKPHVKIILTFSLLEAREAVVFQTKSKPAPFDQTRQRYAKKLG